MKPISRLSIFFVLSLPFILTACSSTASDTPTLIDESIPLTSQGVAFTEPMTALSGSWNTANWTNGSMFNCGWQPDHVSFSGGIMALKLDNTTSFGKPYSSGEYRTNSTYPYGKYEVCFKSAKATGTVSSFFLYTGSPWDEIDIEILGKDTTKAQLNYFVDGIGGNEKVVSLGFDSSTAYHTYAIEWSFKSIKWYVDGTMVYEVNSNTGVNAAIGKKLPNHPMQVMVNLWPGTGVDAWLGSFSYANPLFAYYDYITYTPEDMSN